MYDSHASTIEILKSKSVFPPVLFIKDEDDCLVLLSKITLTGSTKKKHRIVNEGTVVRSP